MSNGSVIEIINIRCAKNTRIIRKVKTCSCTKMAGKNEDIEDHTYAIRNIFNIGILLNGKWNMPFDFSGTLYNVDINPRCNKKMILSRFINRTWDKVMTDINKIYLIFLLTGSLIDLYESKSKKLNLVLVFIW